VVACDEGVWGMLWVLSTVERKAEGCCGWYGGGGGIIIIRRDIGDGGEVGIKQAWRVRA
jgi:hypothetical protein